MTPRNPSAVRTRVYPFHGFAPGFYFCRCIEDGCETVDRHSGRGVFLGAKRSTRCEPCAEKIDANPPTPSPALPADPCADVRETLAEHLHNLYGHPENWKRLAPGSKQPYLDNADRLIAAGVGFPTLAPASDDTVLVEAIMDAIDDTIDDGGRADVRRAIARFQPASDAAWRDAIERITEIAKDDACGRYGRLAREALLALSPPSQPVGEADRKPMKMLVDNEWLREKIASDPDDGDCTAGGIATATQPRPDAQPTDAAQSGFSFPGGYVKGDRASVDAVKQMFHAKERCETLDQMLDNKELVRPADTASADYARAIEGELANLVYDTRVGAIEQSYPYSTDYLVKTYSQRIRTLASVPKNGGRS